MRGLSKYVIS